MSEKDNTSKMKSLRLNPETYDEFEKLYKDLGAENANSFVQTIIDRVYSPMKVNIQNEQIVSDQKELIKKLKAEIEELKASATGLQSAMNDKDESLQAEINLLQADNERLQAEKTQLIEKMALPENSKVIQFSPINLMILEHVAKREGDKRKQDWKIDDIINFFIHFRFELGALNGNMDAVPNSIIREFKKELEG